jgi:hypothetical protein
MTLSRQLICNATVALAFCAALRVYAISEIPANLGNGLEKLVESNLLQKQGTVAAFAGFATQEAASLANQAIGNDLTSGYLIEVMPNGTVSIDTLLVTLRAQFPSLLLQSVDRSYQGHGIIEAFVELDDVPALARLAGVGSVILELKPIHAAGPVTSQGVNLHRVNRINQGYNSGAPVNYDGTGMSVGVLSDSFDACTSTTDRAATDTAADELPSVVVLEDLPSGQGTDEGRAMCQIVHDIAPAARIAFATADLGEVEFANNIRGLAGLSGYAKNPSIQQGFRADVIISMSPCSPTDLSRKR